MGIQWDITWYNQYWGGVKMADLSPSNYDIFSEESEDQPSKPSNVCGALVLVQTTPNHTNEDSTGWWLTYPSEKYSSSVGMMTFPLHGK